MDKKAIVILVILVVAVMGIVNFMPLELTNFYPINYTQGWDECTILFDNSPGLEKVAQSFTIPPGRNRLTNMYLGMDYWYGTVYLKIGIANSLTWNEASWIKTVTKEVKSSDIMETPQGYKFLRVWTSDETTEYDDGKHYAMIQIDRPKSSINSYVGLGLFGHSVYTGGTYYEEYYGTTTEYPDNDLAVSFFAYTYVDDPGNVAPVCISIQGPNTVSVGTSNAFGVQGYDDDGDPITYYVNWGDGTNSGWSSSSMFNKQWDTAGTYQVKAKVKDSNGQESSYCTPISVTVTSGGTFYSMTFITQDYISGEPVSLVQIDFDSQSELTDSYGKAIFDSVTAGTKTVMVDTPGYKPLDTQITVSSSQTKYIWLAPTGSDYETKLSNTAVNPNMPDLPTESNLYIIIAMIIIGIVCSIASFFFVPGLLRYGLIVIIWVIITIIYFVLYGGIL